MSEQIKNEAEGLVEQDLNELLQIRRDKLSELQERGTDPFHEVKFERTNHSTDVLNNYDEMEGKIVSLAGRMMSKRIMGKASFSDISDRYGRIQLYIKRDVLGTEIYQDYKKMDLGDILGIKGRVFKTQKGEISIEVHELVLLSKSLRPLPEKWHGLRDVDMRYRQRYVDLIVNTDVRNTFEVRSKVIRSMRNYLDTRDFMEVETPVLNTIPGGAAARPFTTHHNTLDIDMYLRIATELHLKRLIVGGLEKVYEIGRIFRNEGMSIKHNPEFTTIELYEAYTDYNGMMDLTEDMISHIAKEVLGTDVVNYQGTEISFAKGWERITMTDAVKKYANLDFMSFEDDEAARQAVKAAGIEFEGSPSWGDLLSIVFEERVEAKLIQPTFIMDHPIEVSPLAKKMASNPRLTERFELFVFGRELANAFSELNDPIDQKERFMRQVEMRDAGDDEANMMDEDFVLALEYGMPPTGGLGIGIDRLVMFLTDSYSIRDVLLFPTMKPQE